MTRPGKRLALGSILIGLALAAGTAAAEEAAAEVADEGVDQEGDQVQEGEEEEDPNRFEVAPFPALGGNTDIGFSFGIDARLSRLEEGYSPYRYSIHLNAVLSVKTDPDGDAELPKHEYVLELDFPGLADGRLRLIPRAGFERIVNAGWYGLPGLPTYPDPLSRAVLDSGRRHQFVNMHAFGDLDLRWRASRTSPIELLAGATFRYVMPRTYGGSLLEEDLHQQYGDGEWVLPGFEWHPLVQVRVGLLWDRRDHEIAPTRGTMVEVSTRGSLGFPEDGTMAFMGVTADFRLFVPLIADQRLVWASRVLVDVQLGDVPFYELSRMGTFTPQGFCSGTAIRAAPEGRHAGAAKVVGGMELRTLFAPFRLFNMNMVFGMVFFLNVGHIWSTLSPEPPFEGTGSASAWGAGLGLLLRWGETIMVRIEAGFSPDASDGGLPVGIYMTLGHAY